MKNKVDVRWQQRLDSYKNALSQLKECVELGRARELSNIEKQGLIKAFEFTHELAWNLLKDYIEFHGHASIIGSRDATREGFRLNLVSDGESWMDMIGSRNLSSHTYNKDTANKLIQKIVARYFPLFVELQNKMAALES